MDLNDFAENNPDQIKSLISLLQTLLDQQQAPKSTNQTKKSSTKKTKKPKESFSNNTTTKNQKKFSNSKQTKNTKTLNKFDSMSEFNMHKDDALIDKKLVQVPPVARIRDFEFIDVVCRTCGKKETIAPALVLDSPSRYKCNRCATNAG
jgi:hypothetical protein